MYNVVTGKKPAEVEVPPKSLRKETMDDVEEDSSKHTDPASPVKEPPVSEIVEEDNV